MVEAVIQAWRWHVFQQTQPGFSVEDWVDRQVKCNARRLNGRLSCWKGKRVVAWTRVVVVELGRRECGDELYVGVSGPKGGSAWFHLWLPLKPFAHLTIVFSLFFWLTCRNFKYCESYSYFCYMFQVFSCDLFLVFSFYFIVIFDRSLLCIIIFINPFFFSL